MFITTQVKLNVLSCIVAGSLLSTLTGCGRDDVRTYRVPKETTPQLPAADLPAGWQAAPPGEMRVASYRVKGKDGKMADVSVIPLPGMAGRDIDNVNRWRGQVGLAPVSEGELG